MPRSVSKGAFVDDHLLQKVERMNQNKDCLLYTSDAADE